MDYFTQLLESYDKLKKRKLKLVESVDPQGEALAQQALQQAQAQNPPPSLNAPFQAPGARTMVLIFPTKNGWKFEQIGANGKKSHMRPVEDPAFAGAFSANDPTQDKNTNPNKGADPGDYALQSELAQENMEAVQGVANNFIEIAPWIKDIVAALDVKDFKAWKKKYGIDTVTESFFGNYIFGGRPQSLELQIVNKRSRLQNVNGSLVEIPEPLDAYTALSVSENLKQLFNLLQKQSPDIHSIKDRTFLMHNFAFNSDGSVSVFSDTEDSGVVFKDDTGFLNMILRSAAKKYEVKLKKLSFTKDNGNSGEANNIRGTLFEEILPWISLASKTAKMKAAGLDSSKIEKLTKQLFSNLREKLYKLNELKETWTAKFSNQVLEPDEKSILDELLLYTGSDAASLISSMIKMSKDAIMERSPDFFIPVGLLTGNGERADVLECHSDYNKAKAALIKSGVSPEDIASEGLIVKTTLKDLFTQGVVQDDLYKIVIKSGSLPPDKDIFYTPVSLKNYVKINSIKAGTSTTSSFMGFIRSGSMQNKFLRKGLDMIQANEQELVAYDDNLDQIYAQVKKLGKVKVKDAHGNMIRQNSLKSLVKSAIDVVRKNSSFDDIFSDSAVIGNSPESEMHNLLSKFASEEKEASKTDKISLEDKVKQYMSTYLKNKKIEQDVKANKPEAKKYLMMKLWNCAGCAADGTLVDARSLNNSKSYKLFQNKIVKSVMNSIMNSDGEWIPEFKGNHIHFVSSKNPKVKITLSDKIMKRAGSGYFSTTSSTEFSEAALQQFDIRNKSISPAMLEAFIAYQTRMMEQLYESK